MKAKDQQFSRSLPGLQCPDWNCYHVIVLRDQNVSQHKIFLSSEYHADFHEISNYGKKSNIDFVQFCIHQTQSTI